MPNKFARAVPVNDYKPRGLLPDGLLPVARPDGSEATAMASATGHLAKIANAVADEQAQLEGARAGRTAGLDPNYRPEGASTLRGQAFEKAATATYLDNLDARLRTDMQAAYEANRHNPTELKAAFDRLGAQYEREHVFDDIRGRFHADFARLRMPYQNRALADLEERTRDDSRAALVENVTSSQSNALRAAAADPNSPQTAETVRREIDRLDRLVDAMVADPDRPISAETGARLKIKNRDDVLVAAAVAQAQTLTSPEAVATYRENAKAKFAAGEFDGLTGDGWTKLDAELQSLTRTRRTEGNAGVNLLKSNIDDYVKRAVNGFPVAADEWTRLVASEAGRTEKGAALIASGQAKLQVAEVLRTRSIEDGERLVSEMRATLAKDGAASKGQADLVTFAEEVIKEQRTAINTDQLGLAQQKRIVTAIAPLDFQGFAASNDPAAGGAFAGQMRARAAQARAVGTELSRAPQFLRPEEKARLQEIVSQGGPKALELAGAIVKGAGIDAPNVLREISSDAPLLAQAGNIIANGGSLAAARDAFEAAKIKAATGKDLPGMKPTDAANVALDTFGAAFTMQGEDAGRIRIAADAIAKARIYRGGIDPTSSEATAIYKRALQEAAGAQFVDGVQYGGVADYKPGWWSNYKVPVPAGVRADAFRDVLRTIRDTDLAGLAVPPVSADGRPFTARDIATSVPVWVDGGYRFAQGDPASSDPKYIRGRDGAPFVLPFEFIASLRTRLPRAFLGGQ